MKKASKKKASKKKVSKKAGKKSAGRKPVYTPELADYILAELATGRSLRSICRDDCVPVKESTVRWWAYDDRPEGFAKRYYVARDMGVDALVDETLEIVDDGQNDWMERFGKDGEALGWAVNGEHVSRSRIRADFRKWLISKLAPKRYGDRIDIKQTKDISEATDEEIVAEISRQIYATDSPELLKQLEMILKNAGG